MYFNVIRNKKKDLGIPKNGLPMPEYNNNVYKNKGSMKPRAGWFIC